MPEKALVVVAHADDIAVGAAGTIARWTEAGCVAVCSVVTYDSTDLNQRKANLKELAEGRQREQPAAAEILGVKDVRFLGYQDGILQPTLDLRRDLTRLIREVRPNLVMTFDPTTLLFDMGYINHPDHRATAE